jgi:hypothetical protein
MFLTILSKFFIIKIQIIKLSGGKLLCQASMLTPRH